MSRVELIETITLVIVVTAGAGLTTQLLTPWVCFFMWAVGYTIATYGAFLRKNKRNLILFTFLCLNSIVGAVNWFT